MRIQVMNCPVCKQPATEYDINKWRCLSCQTKFIYEEPTKTSENIILQKIHVDNLGDNFFYKNLSRKTAAL